MASICDDLRRLDKMLLHLAHGSGVTFQTSLVLSLARKRVQLLEKKARKLDVMYINEVVIPSGSGGAAPLCATSFPCTCVTDISWQKSSAEERVSIFAYKALEKVNSRAAYVQ